jgi:DNA-binding CsgD family transcriptional regulator
MIEGLFFLIANILYINIEAKKKYKRKIRKINRYKKYTLLVPNNLEGKI